MKVIGFLFRAAFWLFTIATPLAGFWLASSLAAYNGSSMQLAAIAGLALFPFLPLAWVAVSEMRRKKRGITAKHTLTFGDRLLWRTLFLNLTFLAGLLWLRPETSFLALSTRGDWMVAGLDSPMATLVRDTTDRVTSRIEWLYERARENPYAKEIADEPPPPPIPTPSGPPIRRWAVVTPTPESLAGVSTPEPTPAPILDTPGDAPDWPMAATLDPIVAQIPASANTGPESVGRWLASRIRGDEFRLAKAIHDYIADRIAYDYAALARYPDIGDEVADAGPVWRNRLGVCSGYTDLFRVIAKAAGLEAAYVVGEIRSQTGGVEPIKHAWSAVKVDGAWYLMDVTWDAGGSENGDNTFRKRYSTNYLFAPPEAFGLDHFPDDPRWQLRADPLERAEFVRQPLLRPEFLAKGLELLSPVRPQVDADGSLDIRLRNPRQLSLIVTAQKEGAAEKQCLVTAGRFSTATCTFDAAGRWKVSIYASEQRYDRHPYVAGVEVNDRG